MSQSPADALRAELDSARAELAEHRASWEYAYAMGEARGGSSQHPLHRRTRARTEQLVARCRDLAARLAEHEL